MTKKINNKQFYEEVMSLANKDVLDLARAEQAKEKEALNKELASEGLDPTKRKEIEGKLASMKNNMAMFEKDLGQIKENIMSTDVAKLGKLDLQLERKIKEKNKLEIHRNKLETQCKKAEQMLAEQRRARLKV